MTAATTYITPLFLAGPTAVGKSEVALHLAEQLGGEIVSVDAMQVYRGMDIGTAKPSLADRARVPHHLIDVVDVTERFDAAQFVRLARVAMDDIQQRGRRPIFCGGTGLYFKAFLEGLGEAPASDPTLRAELEQVPLDTLLCELERSDPVTFARIDRRNPRRVVRAVEVIRLTGRPYSVQRSDWSATDGEHTTAPPILGLRRAQDDLRTRIDRRVESMFAGGLVAETQHLLDRGLAHNPTAMQALGYRQVVEHLSGMRSLAETIELVKTRTRQFAKRQMTWFRHQARVRWFDVARDASPEEIAARLVK